MILPSPPSFDSPKAPWYCLYVLIVAVILLVYTAVLGHRANKLIDSAEQTMMDAVNERRAALVEYEFARDAMDVIDELDDRVTELTAELQRIDQSSAPMDAADIDAAFASLRAHAVELQHIVDTAPEPLKIEAPRDPGFD